MTKLENEIKEAFESDKIDVTPQEILEKSNVSFVSKKHQVSLKESLFISFGNLAVAAAVFGAILPFSLTYQETIEDSIKDHDFASHVVGALGISNLAFNASPFDLANNEIEKETLPPIAYLNYTFTNKDKVSFSFEDTKRTIENEVFNVKETIQDKFLNERYNIFLRKNTENQVEGCVYNLAEESTQEVPSFMMQINGSKKDRNCFLDISFLPFEWMNSDLSINLKENFDNSVEFSFFDKNEKVFYIKAINKGDYNLFTIDIAGLDESLLIKIYNKNNMNYNCVYFSEEDPNDTSTFEYTFTKNGTVEENF